MAKSSDNRGGPRRARVTRTLKVELAELIARHLQDRRLSKGALASVNQVELNRDMSIARVYVSFVGGTEAEQALAFKAVDGAAGRLRGPLARRLNLARAPQLRFVRDDSVEFVAKVGDIVREDAERSHHDDEPEPESESESDTDTDSDTGTDTDTDSDPVTDTDSDPDRA